MSPMALKMIILEELLALSINPSESANEWGEIFDDLKKKRGIKNIDLIVADGLAGLENEVHRVFPESRFQKCVVHKMRNILNKTRPKDKAEMALDLKELFDNFNESDTITNALTEVEKFIDKWKTKYPKIDRFFKEGKIEYYFTYIHFHPIVRRMIYTTNSIENLNRVIRKATKNKLSFEKPEYLLDYVFMIIKEFEEKNFQKYPVSNYKYFKI
jgi:transposase-like protein